MDCASSFVGCAVEEDENCVIGHVVAGFDEMVPILKMSPSKN